MHSMLSMSTLLIYKTHPHISAHNFLNIQPIFSLQKFWKAKTEGFLTIPSLLYMLILLILDISISNAFNAIYVEAVDTFSTQYTNM